MLRCLAMAVRIVMILFTAGGAWRTGTRFERRSGMADAFVKAQGETHFSTWIGARPRLPWVWRGHTTGTCDTPRAVILRAR